MGPKKRKASSSNTRRSKRSRKQTEKAREWSELNRPVTRSTTAENVHSVNGNETAHNDNVVNDNPGDQGEQVVTDIDSDTQSSSGNESDRENQPRVIPRQSERSSARGTDKLPSLHELGHTLLDTFNQCEESLQDVSTSQQATWWSRAQSMIGTLIAHTGRLQLIQNGKQPDTSAGKNCDPLPGEEDRNQVVATEHNQPITTQPISTQPVTLQPIMTQPITVNQTLTITTQSGIARNPSGTDNWRHQAALNTTLNASRNLAMYLGAREQNSSHPNTNLDSGNYSVDEQSHNPHGRRFNEPGSMSSYEPVWSGDYRFYRQASSNTGAPLDLSSSSTVFNTHGAAHRRPNIHINPEYNFNAPQAPRAHFPLLPGLQSLQRPCNEFNRQTSQFHHSTPIPSAPSMLSTINECTHGSRMHAPQQPVGRYC